MTHKLLKNDSALKLCESAKSFKEIAEILESEDFSVVDDKILHELSLMFLLKILAMIHTKKTFFYATLIETKLEMILSQDIKESIFVDSQLTSLKLTCSIF